uniref:CNH domain-containing protein n=1 Tax=Ascaris lumbricoides TaxID=6252 RepID=A0A0M3I1Z8_ASCLU
MPEMIADHSEVSTALEVQIPLVLEAHAVSCALSHDGHCMCSLIQNEMVVFKEYNGAKVVPSSIYSKISFVC